jgi:hypothetical protein
VFDEWLAKVVDDLKANLGSQEQKRRAYQAAKDMTENLPSGSPRADRWAQTLMRMFDGWVNRMIYLRAHEGIADHLPESVLRSNAEVSVTYGLRTSKGIEDKQAQLSDAAEVRIARAAAHLRAGWDEDMAVCFVCSRAEWRQATSRAGRIAA